MQIVLSNVEKGRREVDITDANRSIVECLLPVEEACKLDVSQIPWANIRIGYNEQFKSRVVKELKESLYLRNGEFHNKHKGVRVIANSADLDKGKLTIDFGRYASVGNFNTNTRGLGDGGTTVRVISESLKSVQPFVQSREKQYVRLYIHCGDYDKDEVAELVESWNTGLQANQQDMLHYRRTFDDIRNYLEATPKGKLLPVSGVRKFPQVSYYSGDPGQYDITEIIQLLCLFSMEEPRKAYAGTTGCLNFFCSDEGKERFMKVLPLVFDIVYLYETILYEIQDVYNASGKKGTGGKFLATRPVEKSQSSTPTHLPFIGKDIPFTPHKAWALPILSAFRGALEPLEEIQAGRTTSWIANPVSVFRDIGAELYKEILKGVNGDNERFNINAIGRNTALYTALENIVAKYAERAARKGKYAVA